MSKAGRAGSVEDKQKAGRAGGQAGSVEDKKKAGRAGSVEDKEKAGKRSGLKRATKDLLLVKDPWLQLILRKRKTWEIRGSSTHKRGLIHLGLSGSGGEIHGRARITDCRLLT